MLRLREKLNKQVFDLSEAVLQNWYPDIVKEHALYQEDGVTPKSFEDIHDTIYFRVAEKEYENFIQKKIAKTKLERNEKKLAALSLY